MPHWFTIFSRCHPRPIPIAQRPLLSLKLLLPSRNFATSSSTESRQRLTLQARRIRNAGGSLARLRWTGRKDTYRIRQDVQRRRHLRTSSPLKIRGVSRVKFSYVEGLKPHDTLSSSQGSESNQLGKQPVRTKYVWLGNWARPQEVQKLTGSPLSGSPGPISFDPNWTSRFHRMTEKGESVNMYLSLRYAKVERLMERYAGLNVSVRSTHQAWMHMPAKHRLQVWQDVMLWCLYKSPPRALKLLLASMKGNRFRPPRHVVADCLQYLAKHFLHKVANPNPKVLNAMYHLVHKYVAGGHGTQLVQSIPDQVVFLLLKHSDDSCVISLLEKFSHENVQLHANTLLHALERSLDMGNVNISLRLLGLVSRSGLGTHRDQVQSACVRLIRARYDVPEPFSIQTKILTQILEMGVRPKVSFYNAILLNTVEAGYFDLALQMFEIAKANSLSPDEITYRILLQGATLNADRTVRETLVQEMENNTELLRNLRVVSDLLHVISKLRDPAYPAMLALYERHCDLRPLQELGLREVEEHTPSESAIPVRGRWPSTTILGQMICAYVQMHRDSESLMEIYLRYHDFVCQNHPIIAPVAQTDHVANTFIMAFGLRGETLPHCATVVKHMLDDSSSKRLSVQPDQRFPKAAAPTVRTWSILANAYFRHGQSRAAEKVLELMRERGIEPDAVTWNTIINGFTSMQKVGKAVDAFRRMEAAGFRPDKHSMRALSRVYNRERLLSAIGKTLSLEKSAQAEIIPHAQRFEPLSKDDLQEFAEGWEASESLKGNEVLSYLRQRYRSLTAHGKRSEANEPEAASGMGAGRGAVIST